MITWKDALKVESVGIFLGVVFSIMLAIWTMYLVVVFIAGITALGVWYTHRTRIYCKNCHRIIMDTQRYCHYCGTRTNYVEL